MAKKRKAPSGKSEQGSAPDAGTGSSRMRIKTYKDVADSDDEFHMNRDKVLLDEGPEAKRRRRYQEEDEFLQPSDEEVLAYDAPSEEEDVSEEEEVDQDASASEDEDKAEEDEEEGLGGWGSSKQDYYNADAVETEQDALDEEAEAKRIQQKQLQSMTAADYGFDEDEWQETGAEEKAQDGDREVVTEILPQLQLTDQMGPAERLKLLKTRYPEFEPLSKEFLHLQERYAELGVDSATKNPAVATKQRAAAAYLASLTMYFALLTSTADDSQTNGVALSATKLRDHPVMDSLIQCRDLWNKVKDIPTQDLSETSFEDEQASEEEVIPVPSSTFDDVEKAARKSRKQRRSKVQKAADAVDTEAEARRAERIRQAEADFADLDVLTTKSARASASKPRKAMATATLDEEDSDFGEEAELNSLDAAEKAKRKKSLRFYTSQIAQKANKRGAAGRDAGGDDDIPHRERLRDRQTRLNAEAEKRGKNQTRDVLGEESDEEDRRQARMIRGEDGGDDEYYDMVAAKASKKKSDKKALADAHREAAAQGGRVVETQDVGPDGKRAIGYAIEKNKGLTPHRKKDVRNPRVKKRKKYDEKKKKLASQRPVYKGGEGRGGYGGELTGIKKGIVRGTKL